MLARVRGGGRKMVVHRALRYVPRALITQLKYVEASNFTHSYVTGAGAILAYTFRVNSIFDPDYTGTGHQPIARDQWSALYRRYKVLKYTLTVRFINTLTTNDGAGVMIVYQHKNTILPIGAADPQWQAEEQAQNGKLRAKMKHYASPGSGGTQQVFITKRDTPYRTTYDYADRDQGADFGTNPQANCFCTVYNCLPQRTTTTTLRMVFDLRQTVMFSEPVTLFNS